MIPISLNRRIQHFPISILIYCHAYIQVHTAKTAFPDAQKEKQAQGLCVEKVKGKNPDFAGLFPLVGWVVVC